MREHSGVVGVDAHADLVIELWLLAEADDPVALGLDDAEVDVDSLSVRRHGQRGPAALVERHQLLVVERGEDVAVHRYERALQVRHEPQSARRAQCLLLPHPGQLQIAG